MSASGDKRREKEINARFRACMDKEITHLRVKSGLDIRLKGNVWELHGTACTCCPRVNRANNDKDVA